MSAGQLRTVRGFTVGRVGLGRVVCLGPVDLSAADLPSLVQQVTFERGKVCVHSTSRLRHASCRAILHGVYPDFGVTLPAFERRLRRVVERSGQLLVSYNSAAGSLETLIPPSQVLEAQWMCGVAVADEDNAPKGATGRVCRVCHWGLLQGATCCERCGQLVSSNSQADFNQRESERGRVISLVPHGIAGTPPEFDDWLTELCSVHGTTRNSSAAASHEHQVLCSNGHKCVRSAYRWSMYSKGWSCSKCKEVKAGERWYCELCSDDFCYGCYPLDRRAGECSQRPSQVAESSTATTDSIAKLVPPPRGRETVEVHQPVSTFDTASAVESEQAQELWLLVQQWLIDADREWLRDGGTLVLAILRARSHHVQKAFKLARHFSLYREANGWPLRLEVDECRPVLESEICQLLPDLDDEGRAIVLIEGRRLELDQHQVVDYVKAVHLVLERAVLKNSGVQLCGVCVIVDLDDTAAGDALALQGVIKTMQDTFPCKVKRVYIINAGMMMKFALRFVVKSLKPKLQERIVLLEKLKHLHASIAPTKLPSKLGGSCNFDWDKWMLEH